MPQHNWEKSISDFQVISNSTSVFIEKKSSKKCIIQDYRYLNKSAVKKQSSFVSYFGYCRKYWYKKVFTKLDLY